ncbi:MAG: S1 RNA-binding domain-containing protein [Chloroflexota bacterium]
MLLTDSQINNVNEQPSDQDEKQTPQWYGAILEDYDYLQPKVGALLQGTIISMGEEGISVDVGMKRDAIASAKDLSLLDAAVQSELKPGQQVTVYVLNQPIGDQELQVSLSKGIEYQSWEVMQEHLEKSDILELEISGRNRGGFLVKFEHLTGFLPYSQVPEIRNIRNAALAEKIKQDLIGKQMPVKVIEIVRSRNRLIFSALDAQSEKHRERLAALQIDQIILGKVVKLVDFGAFVDLDGTDGLVHLSQLDWKKIKHPSEVVQVGDEIQVKVLQVDLERNRVSLSRKALLPSPWDTVAQDFHPGDYVEGIVKRVVDFGAFVQLETGIEGLVHISQLGYSASQEPSQVVKRGERVLLRVMDVDPDRRRIGLSMRQVPLERQITWTMGTQPETEQTTPVEPVEVEPVEIEAEGGSTEPG